MERPTASAAAAAAAPASTADGGSGGSETATVGQAEPEPEQAAAAEDEGAQEDAQAEVAEMTVEMTSVTRAMLAEGWLQPDWVRPSRMSAQKKPAAPSQPKSVPGVASGSDYIVVGLTMPSDGHPGVVSGSEPIALDFNVQVTPKRRGASMTVVSREDLSASHNDRNMERNEQFFLTVQALSPSEKYEVRVRARNEVRFEVDFGGTFEVI